MKKIPIISSLIVILGIVIYVIIDLNVHTHDKAKTYSYDEEYHWYECKLDCGEKVDKAKHRWDKGTVTKEPTVSSDGVRTFQCEDCGKIKRSVELFANQDKRWESAFDGNNFLNVSAVLTETYKQEGSEFKREFSIWANGSTVYITVVEYENGVEKGYTAKYQEGNYLWNFTSRDQKIENAQMSSAEPTSAANILKDEGLNFGDKYNSFIYNESNNCHEASNLLINGRGLTQVSVKLSGDKIMEITAVDIVPGSNDVEHTVTITFSDYGKTTPKPPSVNDK